jgi:hypothetical protein
VCRRPPRYPGTDPTHVQPDRPGIRAGVISPNQLRLDHMPARAPNQVNPFWSSRHRGRLAPSSSCGHRRHNVSICTTPAPAVRYAMAKALLPIPGPWCWRRAERSGDTRPSRAGTATATVGFPAWYSPCNRGQPHRQRERSPGHPPRRTPVAAVQGPGQLV